jgi:hypothetical protein
MPGGREEREEQETRRGREKQENREDQVERGVPDEWEPESRTIVISSFFSRLMCPSTGPLLHGSVTAASTAFKSCFRVWTKRFKA